MVWGPTLVAKELLRVELSVHFNAFECWERCCEERGLENVENYYHDRHEGFPETVRFSEAAVDFPKHESNNQITEKAQISQENRQKEKLVWIISDVLYHAVCGNPIFRYMTEEPLQHIHIQIWFGKIEIWLRKQKEHLKMVDQHFKQKLIFNRVFIVSKEKPEKHEPENNQNKVEKKSPQHLKSKRPAKRASLKLIPFIDLSFPIKTKTAQYSVVILVTFAFLSSEARRPVIFAFVYLVADQAAAPIPFINNKIIPPKAPNIRRTSKAVFRV